MPVINNAAPVNFCRARFESLVRLGRPAGRYKIGLDIIEQHSQFPDLRAVSQFITDFGIKDQIDPNNIFTLEINTKKQVSACWNLGPIYAAKDLSTLVMQVGGKYFELQEGIDAKGYFIQYGKSKGRVKDTKEKGATGEYTRLYLSIKMSKTTYELPVYVNRDLTDESGEVLKDPGGAIASLLAAEDDQPPEITSLIEYLDTPKEPPIPMAVILEQGKEYELLDILNFTIKTGKNGIQYPSCQYRVKLHDGEIVTVFSDLDSAKFLHSMMQLGVTIDPKTEPQILEVTYAETIIEADGKETHRASAIIKSGTPVNFSVDEAGEDEEEEEEGENENYEDEEEEEEEE